MEYLISSNTEFYGSDCCFLGYDCDKCQGKCTPRESTGCDSKCDSYCRTKTYCSNPQSAGASPTFLNI